MAAIVQAVPQPAPVTTTRPAPATTIAMLRDKGLTETAKALGQGAPDNYYAPAQGRTGVELIKTLGGIIRNGHGSLGYDTARDGLFGLVDDPGDRDVITDVYTGRSAKGITDRRNAYSHGFNAEHTWPQSLGATGIAKSDLHQLLASDIDANGIRGSYPFGKVVDATWESDPYGPNGERSRLGHDAKGNIVFEPRDSVKGNIARALMYFYTRYDGDRQGRYSLQNFKHEVEMLGTWNTADPVDDIERARNDVVYALQGNRNPFIDRPEWAQAVAGATQLSR